MVKEIGENGIGKLISNLKEVKKQLGGIEVKIEPFVMPYIKKKYMDKQIQEGEKGKRQKKLRKYFSYSLLRKQCNRSIYYSFTIPPDIKLIEPDQQINMDSGTWLHKMYEEHLFPMAKLVSENYKEKFMRKSIKDDDGDEIILLIKPDFIIEYRGDKRVIDVKTLQERYFKQFKTSPARFLKTNISGIGIYMQAQFYMYVTELDKATILAHNRNNSKQFEATIWKNDEFIEDLINRVKNIAGCVKKKKIPNQYFDDKKRCRREYCEYINICWRKSGRKNNKEIVDIKMKAIKFPSDFQTNQFVIVGSDNKTYKIILPVPFETFVVDMIHYVEKKLLQEQQKKKIIIPGSSQLGRKIIYIPTNYKIGKKKVKNED